MSTNVYTGVVLTFELKKIQFAMTARWVSGKR
jgi:hypothetical protein